MNINKNNIYLGEPEYDRDFWAHMKGYPYISDRLDAGKSMDSGTYSLPNHANGKTEKALVKESIFRNIATEFKSYDSASDIYAADSDDVAQFVPEFGSIDIKRVKNVFTRIPVSRYKLAALLKAPTEFVNDATFDFENYITKRLGKAFAKAEDKAFILGSGEDEPTGILAENGGAEIGVTASTLTYDDIIKLFFSVNERYRRNAVWLMNDATALALRTLKDAAGNYLWNANNDTLIGKRVIICNDMPDIGVGAKPVAFGDFSYYWIVKRSPVTVRCLREMFALHDENGYLACEFIDGKLVRKDAVKVIKITDTEENADV